MNGLEVNGLIFKKWAFCEAPPPLHYCCYGCQAFPPVMLSMGFSNVVAGSIPTDITSDFWKALIDNIRKKWSAIRRWKPPSHYRLSVKYWIARPLNRAQGSKCKCQALYVLTGHTSLFTLHESNSHSVFKSIQNCDRHRFKMKNRVCIMQFMLVTRVVFSATCEWPWKDIALYRLNRLFCHRQNIHCDECSGLYT